MTQRSRRTTPPSPPPAVAEVRRASRRLVRELGFLETGVRRHGVSHSECHALIELGHHGVLTVAELAGLLNLDKSTTSRALRALARGGLIEERPGERDRRRRPLCLTAKGSARLARIHDEANTQVSAALALLSPAEREQVAAGIGLYAKALGRLRAQAEYELRPIRAKDDPEVARLIRTVMPEFGASGPGFAIHDPEVDAMSKAYRGRRARYYVLVKDGRVVGGGGFAPLHGGAREVCELRKMYFLPEARGLGMGRALLEHVLQAAARAGFRRCYLETLRTMGQARRLYEASGFRPLAKPLGATGHFGCDAWYARALGQPRGDAA